MLSAEIQPYFTTEELNQLARDSGFVQRRSKLDGATFLDLIVFNKEELKQQSLNELCCIAQHEYGIDIKKQSLHERFNKNAVLFLSKVLERILQKHLKRDQFLETIHGFSRILIKDSTSFQVSKNVQEQYPGSGGSGSGAAVRIQFEFDLLSGSIVDLSVGAFNEQDASNAIATVELIKAGELVIRDLGYMHHAFLRTIIDRMAYFISRLHPSVVVYEEDKSDGTLIPLDFETLYAWMTATQTHELEKDVIINKKNPLRLRLLITLLPPEKAEQRIARIRTQQQKKGKNAPSKEYLIRNRFNLFLTNTSPEQLPLKAIAPLYMFRWFIELVFKTWKSVWRVHVVKPVSLYRLQCYIYAKLLTIMTNWHILWNYFRHAWRIGMLIPSIDKGNKFLRTMIRELRGLFTGHIEGVKRCITILCMKINQLKIERHGNKITLMEKLVGWNKELT